MVEAARRSESVAMEVLIIVDRQTDAIGDPCKSAASPAWGTSSPVRATLPFATAAR
jgi:hypothetical protein